ncbi:MAG: LutB/LldF family L-lactate oxidation iron-sulfur protein [Longimicrobiales bacterium]|nr:LutB/LldF family L-lactate oxidation iron-sulfur protein [Longimicrobiales bacterium]
MTFVEPHNYRRAAARTIREQPDVRTSVAAATRSFDARRRAAYAEIDSARWRTWARDVKSHVLTHLDRYLEQVETSLLANGVQVHWAETAADALWVLESVVRRTGARSVVKAKSMLSEELGVNARLEELGARPVETDLGEYIIQLLGEPPSHIVGPAIHKSLDACRRLFHEQLGTPLDAEPDALAAAARAALRKEFLSADIGISGGNFLAADTGTVALIENEGNIRLSTSVPHVHVAFVGIEKVVPRFEDLAGFLQLTARAATGQPIGNFVSLVQGPRRAADVDGPEEVHVVLVDNGRTDLLSDDTAWEALRCVRCGACLNVCPVYRQTGGHAYGWTYSGPIGSIIAPGLLGLAEALPLPHASSLCGACADVCPVRIPIPELLVHWRRLAVEEDLAGRGSEWASRAYAALASSPATFRAAGTLLRWTPWRKAGRALPVLGGWLQEREAPRPSPRSFRALWKEGIE